MTRQTRTAFVLAAIALFPLAAPAQVLPRDVHPDSRNRLARMSGATDVVAGIRLHGSGVVVRWESPLGRPLTELAILVAARDHDQPYEWSLHEVEAVAVGLPPAVIDRVRHRRPPTGVGEKESIVIQTGRELFSTHKLSAESYARAVATLGTSNFVDIVDLMATYTATATRLTAFNQQMPPGWKQFLPLPFSVPTDIHPDSRSRLPLLRGSAAAAAATPSIYGRNLAPEGTGPAHIRRHLGSLASLERNVGRPLIDLAILATAREHDAQYDWTLGELAAVRDGLAPATIDVVRRRGSTAGLADKEGAIVEFARELFGKHVVGAQTYARALKLFGETNLVDLVEVMAQHAGDEVILAAFDQHLPAGQKPLLPIP